MKIRGFNEMSKTLTQAADALKNSDGDLGSVSFDPTDPASIEQAIAAAEAMVDAKFQGSESNPIIAPMMEEMKEQYRAAILEQAAAARLKGDTPDE